MDGNAGVVPDLRDQLAVPDVDGHHVGRAAAQQDLGESAGGGPGVQAPLALDRDGGKGVQRAGQLVSGAADVVVLVGGCDVEARSSSTWRDALASTLPPELTLPSAMRRAAWVRDLASPRLTRAWSSLLILRLPGLGGSAGAGPVAGVCGVRRPARSGPPAARHAGPRRPRRARATGAPAGVRDGSGALADGGVPGRFGPRGTGPVRGKGRPPDLDVSASESISAVRFSSVMVTSLVIQPFQPGRLGSGASRDWPPTRPRRRPARRPGRPDAADPDRLPVHDGGGRAARYVPGVVTSPPGRDGRGPVRSLMR